MKKKWGRVGLAAMALLLLTAFMGASASAEEGGYWSQTVDSEGRVVEIYTYTEPVVVTHFEGMPRNEEEPAVQPADTAVDAPVHMAGVYAEAAPLSSPEAAAGLSAGAVLFGMISLAVLAVALYKAV